MKSSGQKVLFISPQPFFQWRGSPIRVAFDVQALAELGYRVDLLTLPIGKKKTIPGVRIIRVANPFGVSNIAIGPSLLKATFDVLLFFKGLKLAWRNGYKVIHGVEDAGLLGALIAKLTGAELVFEKHSDPLSYKNGKIKNIILYFYGRLENLTVYFANSVICTGPGLVDQVRKMNKNKTVYNIFDIPSSLVEANLHDSEKIRHSLLKNPLEKLITFVGSFAVYQGIDLIFDTIPHVLKQHPNTRFVIIGGRREEIRRRKLWLSERGVEKNVTFLGKLPPDDLPNYLAASDILLSARLEGVNTPLKLLDYLKTGRAIAATDVISNRLLLNENLAVFSEKEPLKFAEGISTLLEDEKLRLILGENGKKLYESKYNFARFKERVRTCYNRIFQ